MHEGEWKDDKRNGKGEEKLGDRESTRAAEDEGYAPGAWATADWWQVL